MAIAVRTMTWLVSLLMVLALAACVSAQAAPTPFPDGTPWYNVSQPLTWHDLKGRAVLLDFFTPGCINCIHMVPVEDKLEQRFGKQLVIIGVDSPKFTNSGTVSGLKTFIRVHDIEHPVVLDANMQIWRAWHAVAWPTFVLVGPDGEVVGRFIGEQTVAELARPIQRALAAAPAAETLEPLPLTPMTTGTGTLESPGGIAVAGKRVAISDTGHNRIILATRSGKVTAVIGGCAGSDGSRSAKAEFSRPHGLTFHAGNLYVADTKGQKIRVIDLKSHAVTTLAGNGERSYVVRGSYPALEVALNSPWDVEWAQGKLYVSMAGDHQIWRYVPATNRFGPWAGTGREGLRDGYRQRAEFAQPSGLDSHAGTLYDADPESSSIRAITLANGRVHTLVGLGLFKFGYRDGPARQALLQHAEGLAWVDGSLYIADTFNNALRRLNLQTHRVSTVAKQLAHPQAVAALSSSKLLVAESGGDRIDVVNLAKGTVSRWRLKGLKPSACSTQTH